MSQTLSFLLLAVCIAADVQGQPAHRRTDDRIRARMDTVPAERWVDTVESGLARDATSLENSIVEIMSSNHIPGLAACAIRDGQIIWAADLGYADYDSYHRGRDRRGGYELLLPGQGEEPDANIRLLKQGWGTRFLSAGSVDNGGVMGELVTCDLKS